MFRRFCTSALILPLAFALLVSGCNRGTTGQPSAAPDWKPDAALLEQLEQYQDIDGYQIRLPRGYEPSMAPPPEPGGKSLAWTGALLGNVRPHLMLTIASPAAGSADSSTTVDQFSELILSSLRQSTGIAGWRQTPNESGQINGVTFVRVNWGGTLGRASEPDHGFLFVGKDGSTFITMLASCTGSNDEAPLKLGTAAVMTFRKKQ